MTDATDATVEEHDETDRQSDSPLGPLLVGLGIVALGVVLITQVLAIDAEGFDPGGPRFLPMVVMVLLTGLGVVYLVQQLAAMRRGGPGHHAERFEHMPAAGLLVGLLVVYALLIGPLGYLLSTSAFFIAAARVLGSRSPARDVTVAIGLALVVYLSFTRLLGVHLPAGVLPL